MTSTPFLFLWDLFPEKVACELAYVFESHVQVIRPENSRALAWSPQMCSPVNLWFGPAGIELTRNLPVDC